MRVTKCLKKVEFPKISVKIKNFKTFYETQTASHLKEIIQPPNHPLPSPLILEEKFSYENIQEDIYKNINTFACKCEVLREYSSWSSRKGAVQMLFLRPTS